MKKLLLTAIFTLSAISAFADVAMTVTGTGSAESISAPTCDEDSLVAAELAADQDSTKQCGHAAVRVSEYSTSCHLIAHGYSANAMAVATYRCQ